MKVSQALVPGAAQRRAGQLGEAEANARDGALGTGQRGLGGGV